MHFDQITYHLELFETSKAYEVVFFPPHHVVAPSGSHIQNLFVCSCFSCSLSSLFSLSALHPVMDQRTCPKVLYRQHTCSMSLHADVTLQLQPCTVDMCVCVYTDGVKLHW